MYLVDRCDGSINDLAFKGFEYDCLVFDGKLCESDARDYFSGTDINFLMIEDADDIAVLSGTCSLDVGEQFMFEIGSHIGSKEGGMEGQS